MREIAWFVVPVTVLWVAAGLLYRYAHGAWLKVCYWPLALGICVRGEPLRRWERVVGIR